MANTTLTIETIVQRGQAGELLTPYQIAKILNALVTEFGVKKDGKLWLITPQQMYQYDKNGMIVKGKRGVQRYTLDEVIAFVNKRLGKYEVTWSPLEEEESVNEYQSALDALNDDEELVDA